MWGWSSSLFWRIIIRNPEFANCYSISFKWSGLFAKKKRKSVVPQTAEFNGLSSNCHHSAEAHSIIPWNAPSAGYRMYSLRQVENIVQSRAVSMIFISAKFIWRSPRKSTVREPTYTLLSTSVAPYSSNVTPCVSHLNSVEGEPRLGAASWSSTLAQLKISEVLQYQRSAPTNTWR